MWLVVVVDMNLCESVFRSFRTGRLERELQMLQLSVTRCSCIAILRVSLVSFVAITICNASQRVFIVIISLSTQSGNFSIHPRLSMRYPGGGFSCLSSVSPRKR